MTADIEDSIRLVKSNIISASRRTDIPACFMPQIMDAFARGSIDVRNRGRVARVSLLPADVKCIVWWSKNYAKWLATYKAMNADPNSQRDAALLHQFKHMFNFTINGSPDIIEPIGVPLSARLDQLRELTNLFGARSIKLRFDPIVVYSRGNEERRTNLENFEQIARCAHSLGIRAIIFAFCIGMPKVVRRMSERGITLINLSLGEQRAILDNLIGICANYEITLETCCNSQLIGYRGIIASHCIDGAIANEICGSVLRGSQKKDIGQRAECNCAQSRDIGSYEMKCGNNCIYCYANTTD